jgi:sugar O-acyltransferase (sialic acid O-acetyltransferase NeuD family)
MTPPRKLIIVGNSGFAEIANEYFTHDSDYDVVGFSVERAYRAADSFCDKPNVDFEELAKHFAPAEHAVYVAATYTQLNRLRARLSGQAKQLGFTLASYVSSRAFVWRNVRLGEHCFIFEDNTLQPFVQLGDNVLLWSGNHIGHHSLVRSNCFISSHVVISGYCDIGPGTFLGVNSTISNNVTIARDNWVGPGVTITKNTEPGAMFKHTRAEPASVSAPRFFKLEE